MTQQPPIQVGQIWERVATGQRVRITAVTPTNLLELEHLDRSRRARQKTSHPMAATLRSNYRLLTQPTEQP